MNLSLIVAMDRNRVIGRQGMVPWWLPRDLRNFRSVTWGKPMIMGRRTWEAMGRRALAGRTSIVVSRQPCSATVPGQVWAWSPEMAVALAATTGADEAVVIGGGLIYESFLPSCSAAHITLVETEVEGDTVFPADLLQSPDWHLVHGEDWPADRNHHHSSRYLVLRRTQNLLQPATGGPTPRC